MMQLADLQRAFQERVLHGSQSVEAVVPGTEAFDTEARLWIYEHAYRARLAEALADSYPAVRQAMSERKFESLVHEFAIAAPPGHFSIRYYGRDLGDFIASKIPGTKGEVLCQLAQWEWMLRDAFDASDAPAVTRTALASIAPEQWSDVRFRLSPSLRRMSLASNAVRWWRAAVDGAPRPTRWSLAKPVEWAIWRAELATYFRSLKSDEAWAIDAVARGESFGALCEGLVPFCDETNAPARAAALLHQWLHDQWIAKVWVGRQSDEVADEVAM